MRRAKPKEGRILPDPAFGDRQVTKSVNHLMYDGKKSLAYSIFYRVLDIVKDKMSQEERSALEAWKAAPDNVTPHVEVRSRYIGRVTFQVPTEMRPERRESIFVKNLIISARKRGGKTTADKLVAEIMDAYNSQGGTFKRKEDVHRVTEANRIFAHFCF